ncbi:MAG: glycosyltransferase [Saprospiraceae bacterium]|nr:glycosyltransferase [Saprospiraceae bacterium]
MIQVFFICTLLLAIAYAVIMLFYWYGWCRLPEVPYLEDEAAIQSLTVVIPARNEEQNMADCLYSILACRYPYEKFEVLVIDDHSDDDTVAIVEWYELNAQVQSKVSLFRVLHLADYLKAGEELVSFKKKALSIGIQEAKHERIVCIDADCRMAPEVLWLHGMAGNKMAIGPVVFEHEKNLLERFQSLDFLGLMGITGAGIQLGWQHMGNGANLSYPKALFEAVGGFSGSENRASGDDLFLIQKVAAFDPTRLVYLKNPAAVYTKAKPDLRSFIAQRVRWGSKNAALPEWQVKLVLALVFAFCCLLLIDFTFLLFNLANPATRFTWFILVWFGFAGKALFDYIFLREMCRYFQRKDLLPYFWPSFFLHTLYIPVLGTMSLFATQYTWKGRKVQ